jgi:hypothetical protein
VSIPALLDAFMLDPAAPTAFTRRRMNSADRLYLELSMLGRSRSAIGRCSRQLRGDTSHPRPIRRIS